MRRNCSCHLQSASKISVPIDSYLVNHAVLFPQKEVLKFIIDNADVKDMQNRDDGGPLHFACYYDHLENVLLLLSHGVNVNLKNNAGQTALHLSSSSKSTGMIKSLIAFGANVSTMDKDGVTALHRAVALGNLATCEHLVDSRAEIDLEDKLNQTQHQSRIGKKTSNFSWRINQEFTCR